MRPSIFTLFMLLQNIDCFIHKFITVRSNALYSTNSRNDTNFPVIDTDIYMNNWMEGEVAWEFMLNNKDLIAKSNELVTKYSTVYM